MYSMTLPQDSDSSVDQRFFGMGTSDDQQLLQSILGHRGDEAVHSSQISFAGDGPGWSGGNANTFASWSDENNFSELIIPPSSSEAPPPSELASVLAPSESATTSTTEDLPSRSTQSGISSHAVQFANHPSSVGRSIRGAGGTVLAKVRQSRKATGTHAKGRNSTASLSDSSGARPGLTPGILELVGPAARKPLGRHVVQTFVPPQIRYTQLEDISSNTLVMHTVVNIYNKLLLTGDDMYLINARSRDSRGIRPNHARGRLAIELAMVRLGLPRIDDTPPDMLEKVIRAGNKTRNVCRDWFVNNSDELFPFIFPPWSEGQSDEEYLAVVKQNADKFLDMVNPCLIYPIDTNGNSIYDFPFEADWVIPCASHIFFADLYAPGIINAENFNDGLPKQCLATLCTAAYVGIKARIYLLEFGRLHDLTNNEYDLVFLNFLSLADKISHDQFFGPRLDRFLEDLVKLGRDLYERLRIKESIKPREIREFVHSIPCLTRYPEPRSGPVASGSRPPTASGSSVDFPFESHTFHT